MGNVFTAFRNQAPLVITAGQQARGLLPLRPFLGATDAAAFPKPYVKWSCEPARAQDVPAAIAHAYHVAGRCALFASDTPLFQLTADGDAAAAAPVGTGVLGSLRLSLAALLGRLPTASRPAPRRRARPATPPATDPITAEFLLHTLAGAMPDDAILVEEAPSHRPALQAHLPIRDWGRFYTMASGGLGYALPAAAGIALAKPGRRIVCLIGDGSLMYSVQALWTAAQHKLPITVIVINNGGYGAMRSFSGVMRVQNVPGIDLPGLDFVSLARGLGCAGMRVGRAAEVGGALQSALGSTVPVLVDVAVNAAAPKLYESAMD